MNTKRPPDFVGLLGLPFEPPAPGSLLPEMPRQFLMDAGINEMLLTGLSEEQLLEVIQRATDYATLKKMLEEAARKKQADLHRGNRKKKPPPPKWYADAENIARRLLASKKAEHNLVGVVVARLRRSGLYRSDDAVRRVLQAAGLIEKKTRVE